MDMLFQDLVIGSEGNLDIQYLATQTTQLYLDGMLEFIKIIRQHPKNVALAHARPLFKYMEAYMKRPGTYELIKEYKNVQDPK